ncbi:RIO kinase 1 [Branchiibius hedensis]|uniref:non-specific serine/threonine protein kinase n=2 Tax=Branchiibius hedensis TaxID=672460 RepID=A0A2Y8ZTF8_9MICO|nr:RIO kinase 1 [Branchiibius hedensis]SSA33529.1 RIO kinase 1 [Branchiibius hedensis]
MLSYPIETKEVVPWLYSRVPATFLCMIGKPLNENTSGATEASILPFPSHFKVHELEPGQRWSTWRQIPALSRGPAPWPDWLVADDESVETELGILKTGKEADVFLLERASVTGPPRTTRLAAKRYRDLEHTSFTRTADYTEGRGIARKGHRERRALAKKTSFGKQLAAGRWAMAEWESLVRLFEAGLPVPYPAQIDGTEILMELITHPDGSPAPRLAALRAASREQLADLFDQTRTALITLAGLGVAHGDLSAYNLLVAGERLVIIDVPQTVDLIGNPHGMDFLHRDCRNVATWFAGKGLPVDGDELFGEVAAHAW